MLLTWPEALRPSSLNWSLSSNAVEFKSPFNGASQTASFPGSAWTASMTFNKLDDWESRKLEVLIVKLDGKAGRILISDMGRWGRPPMGRPVVQGQANTGLTLSSSGWTPNRFVLREGDYISVDNELKMVTEDIWSDGGGNAIIPIAPMWRKNPQAGATIETLNPCGIFRLDDNINGVDREPAMSNNITLKFVEAI